MTENEAIEIINKNLHQGNLTLALDIARKSITELQQYRAIGTVEECREARERQRVKDIIHNPDSGVDEDWLCPTCGKFCSPYSKHCQNCGQSVKVGNAP